MRVKMTHLWLLLLMTSLLPSTDCQGNNPGRSTGTYPGSCKLIPIDPNFRNDTEALRKENDLKLINYQFIFGNQTTDPLNKGNKWTYRADQWTQVVSKQGSALITMSHDYGTLSLSTLQIGVKDISVKVRDEPSGCLASLGETDKEAVLRHFLVEETADSAGSFYQVCHQIVQKEGRYARFAERCCRRPGEHDWDECEIVDKNYWLHLLSVVLLVVRIILLLIGPLFIPKRLYSERFETFRYLVKFNEVFYKTIFILSSNNSKDVNARVKLDLNEHKHSFPRCRKLIKYLPRDKPLQIRLKEYDIAVNYHRLLPEHKVHVSLLGRLARAIFYCKIKEVGEFQRCCYSDQCGKNDSNKKPVPHPYIRCCRPFGKILLALFIPLPYYLRVVAYYNAEAEEMALRREYAARLGLHISYYGNLVSYLSPVHPFWICVYVVYFITCWLIGSSRGASRFDLRKHFSFVAFNALNALHYVDRLAGLNMLLAIFLWPMERFGWFGILIGLFYWPILLPVGIIIFVLYVVPIFFLTIRVIIGPRYSIMRRFHTTRQGVRSRLGEVLGLFETRQLSRISPPLLADREMPPIWEMKGKELFLHILARIMCLISLWAIMILFMESIGFIIDVIAFTLMGVLANAASLIKLITLLLVIFLYGWDIFKGVKAAYLKLNRCIFSDLVGRIKELREVTALPSFLQQNRGFKACELSEQGVYEIKDNIVMHKFRETESHLHWYINDLVMFVDKYDVPRIPRKLFDEACGIKIKGAPGPVYRSYAKAFIEFMSTVLFLVIVYMIMKALGEEYGLSTSSTVTVTVIGSFLPLLFRYIFKAKPPELQLGSVSFKGKLDEMIKSFNQRWPLYDLPFEVDFPSLDKVITYTADADENKENGKKEEDKIGEHLTEEPEGLDDHLGVAGMGMMGALAAAGMASDRSASATPEPEERPAEAEPPAAPTDGQPEPAVEEPLQPEEADVVEVNRVVPLDVHPLYTKPPKQDTQPANPETDKAVVTMEAKEVVPTTGEPRRSLDDILLDTDDPSNTQVDILIIPPEDEEADGYYEVESPEREKVFYSYNMEDDQFDKV